METRLALLLGLVLLLRLPFLHQAVQGDDHIYLSEAAHALIDPLQPANTKYVFLGDEVDLRGHSHPPMNAWILAGLLAAFGDFKEVPFHAAYAAFSLIAVAAMWSLARRWSPHPVWAVLLFMVVPAFVVNGTSLESDLPFLAFWMAALALFCSNRLLPAAVFLALAAMTAYQAVLLTPILLIYVLIHQPHPFAAAYRAATARERLPHTVTFLVPFTPILVIVCWQIFTRLNTGAMPAAILGGYFAKYDFQKFTAKLASGLMLLIHSWFIIFPALIPPAAILAWRKRHEKDTQFLLAWITIFLCGALVIFFAGSARYLLPMAAPIAILASRLRAKWLAPAFALQAALSLGLAAVNYQHWDQCRAFAASLRPKTENHRVFVNAELGLRHYLESDGALPLRKDTKLRPGDIVVSSDLERSIQLTDPMAEVASAEIRPACPLRLIGLQTKSGYSTVTRGFLPFGIEGGVIDRLHAQQVADRTPQQEFLTIKDPEAAAQFISGIYPGDGWTGRRAEFALKSPSAPRPLQATIFIAEGAPARRFRLLLDGKEVAARTVTAPGLYTIESTPVLPAAPTSVVSLEVDRTWFAPGDRRELGVVLTTIGFLPAASQN